tara:strand:+ start:174 stop:1214 length:1041 start_codon:yes stop_codon:yes gene_type:complete
MLTNNKTFFIAEAGVNHNGSIKMACKLIDIASDAGADFVKFQHTNPNLISSKTNLTSDQKLTTKSKINQKKLTESFHLDWEKAYPILIKRSKKKKIKFLTSVFSSSDYDKVKKYKLGFIKIASGEIVNLPLLINISKSKDTVFLSTGGSNLTEIERAIKILKQNYKKKKIFLLHCVSSYPAPINQINLRSIEYLIKKTNCEVGYSDHGLGSDHLLTAIGFGAKVIEKHFTIRKSLNGPDHKISSDPSELKKIIKRIRKIELSLGTFDKKIQVCEKKNISIIRQSLHASKLIKKNTILNKNNITLMRPYNGINPMNYLKIINKYKTKKEYKKQDPIRLINIKKIKRY